MNLLVDPVSGATLVRVTKSILTLETFELVTVIHCGHLWYYADGIRRHLWTLVDGQAWIVTLFRAIHRFSVSIDFWDFLLWYSLHLLSHLLEVDAVVGEGCCAEWTFSFLPFPALTWNRSCLPEKPITEKRLTLGGVGLN